MAYTDSTLTAKQKRDAEVKDFNLAMRAVAEFTTETVPAKKTFGPKGGMTSKDPDVLPGTIYDIVEERDSEYVIRKVAKKV